MSEVDERIRREVQGLTHPVRTDGVLEHVARRRVRRGRVHRAGVIGLVVVVVAASVVGGIGLTKLFGHTAGAPATGGESPTPADWQRICDESALSTDLDGDSTGDEVSVFSPSQARRASIPCLILAARLKKSVPSAPWPVVSASTSLSARLMLMKMR